MARNLLIALLALAIAGFGGCSFCGGMIFVQVMSVEGPGLSELGGLALFSALFGAAICAACWLGLRSVLRQGKTDEAPRGPGQA